MATKAKKQELYDKRRKTLKNKAEKLINLLEKETAPVYKSDLEKVGFASSSATKWLDLLLYLQEIFESKTLEVQQAGRYKTIQLKKKEN